MDKIKQITIASGGVIATSFLPLYLYALRIEYNIQVNVALSPEALNFVTLPSMRAISGGVVYTKNVQFDSNNLPLHITLSQSDLLILYPASARIIAQCATGEINCCVTRLFAFTPKEKIIICPILHPQMERQLYQPHITKLESLGCKIIGSIEEAPNWVQIQNFFIKKLRLKARDGNLRSHLLSSLIMG
ncbi:hypothetical protein L6Q79_11460 [bacterium]|nr:hypothetical protein [bacterium]NUN46896.1 hypothetical protein [bacterium]